VQGVDLNYITLEHSRSLLDNAYWLDDGISALQYLIACESELQVFYFTKHGDFSYFVNYIMLIYEVLCI
jgi:hypothetical protein